MEIFKNLRQMVTSESAQELSPVKATTTEEQKVAQVKVKFEHDVIALQQAGYSLVAGSLIELTLQEALKIMPRDRKRTDAYNSLVKYLDKQYAVRLVISSRKSNNNNKTKNENEKD